jgi:hypothetical protein
VVYVGQGRFYYEDKLYPDRAGGRLNRRIHVLAQWRGFKRRLRMSLKGSIAKLTGRASSLVLRSQSTDNFCPLRELSRYA